MAFSIHIVSPADTALGLSSPTAVAKLRARMQRLNQRAERVEGKTQIISEKIDFFRVEL